MGLPSFEDGETRFSAYIAGLTSVIGHADRAKPLRDYCVGLMMPCERKSVEPMAAITAPERTAAQHQSLLHFVGEGKWSDEKVLAKVRELMLPEMERQGPIEARIIDDTGFPKKGQHSVGVSRQYCGQLGKQDNCQVAVTLWKPGQDFADAGIRLGRTYPSPIVDHGGARQRALEALKHIKKS
jgi:SRSO17 transposase